ncbi:hypothetical protein [Humibacter sp.]|uniref:hypothetical protein n=1 Tax=Humibacter sp. TaxID=1940291 RepID=UPI003F7D3A8A
MSEQPTPHPQPIVYADVRHADAEAREMRDRVLRARADVIESRGRRARQLERIREGVPTKFATALGVSDENGSATQTFARITTNASGKNDAGCGCSKPDFSSIKEPTVVEFIMTDSQAPSPPRGRRHSAGSTSLGVPASPGASVIRAGGRTIDQQGAALAARVRATQKFAAKAQVVVLFDDQGQVLGTADPAKVQVPDGKKLVAAFTQEGQFLGLVSPKDVQMVANSTTQQQPADQQQQPQPQPQMASRTRVVRRNPTSGIW